jgi:hypothetical protein
MCSATTPPDGPAPMIRTSARSEGIGAPSPIVIGKSPPGLNGLWVQPECGAKKSRTLEGQSDGAETPITPKRIINLAIVGKIESIEADDRQIIRLEERPQWEVSARRR